jgi:hypothetical protein
MAHEKQHPVFNNCKRYKNTYIICKKKKIVLSKVKFSFLNEHVMLCFTALREKLRLIREKTIVASDFSTAS